MTLWVTSDSHFGHQSLLEQTNSHEPPVRSFDSVKQMNECIADHWTDCIAADDHVYHLGDVYFGEGWRELARLSGKKFLVLGNHDDPLDPKLGEVFAKISLWKTFEQQRLVLTHLPVDLSDTVGLGARFDRNIHGHLHRRPSPTAKHMSACVEQTEYKPLNLEELLEV